jgi:hypothetical protein
MRSVGFFLLLTSLVPLGAQTTPAGGVSPANIPSTKEVKANPFEQVDWVVDIGAFLAQVDSNVRIDGRGPGDIGTIIDFETDLGLAEQELLFNAQVIYQGWDKWSLGLEWFQLNRSSAGSLHRDIEWGDTSIPVGADISSFFDVNILRVFGGYEVWRNSDSIVGIGLGVHGADMTAGINGSFLVGNGRFDFEEEADTGIMLPLPNFGIWGSHAFSDKLFGTMRVDGFALEIDEYRGVLWSLGANLRYKATDQLSLGAGYSYFYLEVDMERRLWRGEAKFSYHGPKAFIFYTW